MRQWPLSGGGGGESRVKKLRGSKSEPCGSAVPVGVAVAAAWSTLGEWNIKYHIIQIG